MTAYELTSLVTAAANALSSCLTVNELNLLGAVFAQFGDTLTVIASQRSLLQSTADDAASETS
jgi:hypothetical protein